MKLRYVPGIRPTPMLMYYIQPEKKIFDELSHDESLLIKIGSYTEKLNHIWNMNSYIIYNENNFKIESFVINNFSNFIYLLRNMNKPLTFEINEKEYNLIKSDLEDIFKDEFEII